MPLEGSFFTLSTRTRRDKDFLLEYTPMGRAVSDLFDDNEGNKEGGAEKEEEGEADQQHFLQSTPASPQAGGSDPVLEAGRDKHRPEGSSFEKYLNFSPPNLAASSLRTSQVGDSARSSEVSMLSCRLYWAIIGTEMSS